MPPECSVNLGRSLRVPAQSTCAQGIVVSLRGHSARTNDKGPGLSSRSPFDRYFQRGERRPETTGTIAQIGQVEQPTRSSKVNLAVFLHGMRARGMLLVVL